MKKPHLTRAPALPLAPVSAGHGNRTQAPEQQAVRLEGVDDSLAAASDLPNLLIRASAGTGKTFQISNRYLQLILTGHPAERILATTFTRKAAGEILQRIVFRLASAATEASAAAQLATELQLPWLELDDCRRVLRQLIDRLHRLRVATLDAFFLQATQSLSLELGLPTNWTLADEADDVQLRNEAVRQLLNDGDRKHWMQLLDWLAKGETKRGVFRMLTDAVASMYDIYLDSSEKAWQRLKRKTGLPPKSLALILQDLDEWTVPSSSDRRLQTSVAKVRELAARSQWDKLLASGLCSKVAEGDAHFYRKPIPDDVCQSLTALVHHARAEIFNRIQLQTKASYELLHRFHEQYEPLKLDQRMLGFPDLARCLARLEQGDQRGRLAFRLDAHVDSLLLDEFQDTSLDQWRVMRPFAAHACEPDPQHSFLCVGDTKQAIYGWRGGNADLLDAIPAEIDNIEERPLDRSFRSSQVVIDVVNLVNQSMRHHPNLKRATSAVNEWCQRFPHHTTSRAELPGYVSLETCDVAESTEQSRAMALAHAAERVKALRDQSPQLSIGVLVRTNDLVGQAIHALRSLSIPASEEGGNALTDSAAVQLIMSLLTIADHPQDSAACFHVAMSPWADELGFAYSSTGVAPQVWQPDSAAARGLSNRVRVELADDGYGRTITRWVDQLDAFCNDRERRRLWQLSELAYRYQRSVEAPRSFGFSHQQRVSMRTAGFIDLVRQYRVSDPTEDAVRVMNVHQSKGLQFDVVILPDLERKLLGQTPTCVTRRTQPTDRLETVMRYVRDDALAAFPRAVRQVHQGDEKLRVCEELCVLYVALTRAVHSLQMIVTPTMKTANDSQPTDKQASPKSTLKPTFAGVIRHALVSDMALPPNTVVYEHGERSWAMTAHPPSAGAVAARPPTTAATSAQSHGRKVLLKPRSSHLPTRSGEVVRPSDGERDAFVRLRDLLSRPNDRALRRGTLVHAFFEQLSWIEDEIPSRDQLFSVGLALDAEQVEIEAAIDEFHRLICRTTVRALLSRSFYANWHRSDSASTDLEVRREQRISLLRDDGWMSGSIDRLVLRTRQGIPIAADVIDFKTDRVSDEPSVARLAEHYHAQLQSYCLGISRMIRIRPENISAKLLLLDADRLVDIPAQE